MRRTDAAVCSYLRGEGGMYHGKRRCMAIELTCICSPLGARIVIGTPCVIHLISHPHNTHNTTRNPSPRALHMHRMLHSILCCTPFYAALHSMLHSILSAPLRKTVRKTMRWRDMRWRDPCGLIARLFNCSINRLTARAWGGTTTSSLTVATRFCRHGQCSQ